MNTVARDQFGVLSSKNSVSKYWGVSKVKNKDLYTVRFMEKTNKEVITFKPNFPISEVACAVIAARFFDEPTLYALAEEPIEISSEGNTYKVNTCTNVISLISVKEPLKGFVQETNSTTEVFEKLLSAPIPKPEKVETGKKIKKEKVVDHFRNLVDSIIADALTKAEATLAVRDQALFA